MVSAFQKCFTGHSNRKESLLWSQLENVCWDSVLAQHITGVLCAKSVRCWMVFYTHMRYKTVALLHYRKVRQYCITAMNSCYLLKIYTNNRCSHIRKKRVYEWQEEYQHYLTFLNALTDSLQRSTSQSCDPFKCLLQLVQRV